ncbi:unnamed protein product [Cunninghamella echinulata]
MFIHFLDKRYRKTTIEPFNPRHNVIVGRNGSGKSNFFSAIQFVLGDAYTTLNKEERQALLHEGVGAATISAYVEIIFDNADHKFPIDKPEVTLRRSIGLSLDEYSLDGKNITKTDVKNLFESAGLSSANPYYVVPQGRINSLTVAKDKDRLELLKDIAGTSVYEEKRKESIKIMQETDAKQAKITELLNYIQERLSELEEEKEELSQFQNLDAERRALEYTIFMREQMDTNNKLDDLNTTRQNDLDIRDTKRDEYNDNETSILALEDQRRDLKQSIQIKEMEKTELQDELDDLMKLRTQLELQIKDLEDSQLSENEYKNKMNSQLEQINKEIQAKENELETITPQYQDLLNTDQSLRQQMDTLKLEMDHLYAKQARLSQYSSREERDQWLQGQINELNSLYANLQEQMSSIGDEKESLNENHLQKTQLIEDIQTKLMERRKAKEDVLNQTNDLKQQRDQLTEDRKTLWREEAGLDALLQNCKDEIHKAERTLSSSMDKNTSIGLNAIQRITKENKISGVCGPLYELFDVDDRFKTAVEVAAGTSLFNVVVENDDIATNLLDAMRNEKGGRVTFVPLNRIKDTAPVEYPSANDAIPLIGKLTFDPKYQKVFEQIFSRIIVCPNLEIASSYAKTQGFTVVTLSGDRIDGRGAFFGGYTDFTHRHSRIEAAKSLKQQKLNLEKNQHRRMEIKQEVEVLNQKITKILSDLQILETKNKKWQIQVDPSDQIAKLRKEEDYYKQLIEQKEKSLSDIKQNIESITLQRNNYQNELQTEPTHSLSPDEQATVARNRIAIEEIQQRLLATSESKLKIESQINDIKAILDNDLKRKRDDLINKKDRINDVNVVKNDLNQRNKEHKAVVKRLGRLIKRITELENEIDNDQDRLQKYKENIDQLNTIQMTLETEIVKLEKHLERHLYRRSILQQKKEECNANIRDLGVLPENAFDKYVGFSIEKLLRRLHRANESLKRYGHVNKKAVEQYNRFTKQKDQLITRKTELDTSAQSIRRLVETLDRRKNESIERTFHAVANNFSNVFRTLVPAGHGELIMNQQSPLPENDSNMDIDDNNNAMDNVDRYTGVAIKVSFNSQVDEGILMQQLSGGQKSLVALALIFAIQKCDPAPFYLFDEIDANLDTQYRTAVANMIHTLATEYNQQFITTTFRPELLDQADQFYGVTFQNKVSRIHAIQKDYAYGFLEEEDQAN